MNPVIVGPLTFHPYGLVLGLAALVGYETGRYFLRRHHRTSNKPLLTESQFTHAFLYALLFGLLGARLYHVIDQFSYYLSHPLEIFFLWQGGLGWWGGLIGALLGLVLFAKTSKRFFVLLDLVALSLPLTQALGRLGNFINQELYGPPTDLPWGIAIDPVNRLPGYEAYSTFHPLFLYEALGSILIFLLLLRFYFRSQSNIGSGRFFFLYLILFSLLRFGLEPLRLESWTWGPLPVASVFSILGIFLGLFGLKYLHDHRR